MPQVLIVTNSGDIHSDDLVRACERKGVGCFRYNTDHVRTRGVIESHSTSGTSISIDGRSITFADVGLLVYRRPLDVTPSMLDHKIDPWALSFLNQEWNFFERAFPEIIKCKTINSPSANHLAQNKVSQIEMAKKYGLFTPATLISNSPSSLKNLTSQISCITKAIGNGSHLYSGSIRTGYTRKISSELFSDSQERFTIGLVQAEIKPSAMWRIIVVGNKSFGFRLSGASLYDIADSRMIEEQLDGGLQAVPDDVRSALFRMMKEFGIHYASSDFIEDKDGKLWFIDLNPEGQWGAYEQRFNVPISDYIIDEIDTPL
jgi:glutathione synthase/RimK-type ligase-like ATP-grasp enzyme